MELINHTYINQKQLEEFIQRNNLSNKNQILVQVFTCIKDKKTILNLIQQLKTLIPNTKIIGTSASYEISSKGLHTNETIISFSIFKNTIIETYLLECKEDSFQTGKKLINQIPNPNDPNIKAAICFSNKNDINGDELLYGINSVNASLVIAGGIAGDYVEYNENFIFTENFISSDATILATLYNPNLNIITDYNFNWDVIGTKHTVTKSIKNRVYEIDNMTTLEFYQKYLGADIADDIIETCFGIPLVIEKKNINIGRAIIKLHDDGSISYSGNIKEKSSVRFGYGNTNLILEKSEQNLLKLVNKSIEGIYIFSCLGRRKAFMSKSINIEIERHNKIAPMSGFLTHGEFYHGNFKESKNRFLNQTMTILALSELEDKQIINEQNKTTEISREYKKYLALNNLISKTSSELEDLTLNLEKRVKEEILKNEEKDKLLYISQAQSEIGSMLEMIAHQWRQPLSAISSLTSSIQIKNELSLLEENELENSLDQILKHVYFANETIEDFRSLFKEEQKAENIRIDDLIKKVKTILKSIITKNSITIKEEYLCSKDEIINIPLGQTLQVLINIIKNSIDAINEKNIQNPKITFSTKKDDRNFILSIEDNGGGISKENLPKIFDKRFSTKRETHGTGIGLDICKSIIEGKLQGTINASNSENGAIFEISIPLNNKRDVF